MNNHPTKKQLLILDFISNFISENDVSPSYREIAAGVGLSSIASVAEHVNNLIEKGFLKKSPGAARSLEVVNVTNLEVCQLFRKRLISATPEEQKILQKAAKILGINL